MAKNISKSALPLPFETDTTIKTKATLSQNGETPLRRKKVASLQKSEKTDLAHSVRLGKDEMNLVEHPFALLRRSSDTVIHFEWDKIHPRTDKTIKAAWRVAGDPQLGLPGPPEERLYLILMELAREQGWPQKVMFSRPDLLQRLGMSKNSDRYAELDDSFLRLKSVTINATRSFWMAEIQDFAASLQFNILDEVKIAPEVAGRRSADEPLALSSFTWSRVLHASFIAGNIRSMPIDFVLSLELPLSARLFRYLDKHRTGSEDVRCKYEIELHRLCEVHLGMTKAKYPSKLKERLLPALNELKARGFLADWAFESMKSAPGNEKAVFWFGDAILETTRAPEHSLPELATMPDSLAPVFAVLSSIELEDEDFAPLDGACDQVFKTLDLEVQDAINVRAKATLPPFLQDNMSSNGAIRGIEKERRAIVWCDHKPAVYEIMQTPNES